MTENKILVRTISTERVCMGEFQCQPEGMEVEVDGDLGMVRVFQRV